MRTHTAVRFRAYPTEEQARQIDRTIGCARLVYNLMLETRIAHYQTTWESCYPTPALYKDTYPFLREVDSFALCNAQLALEKAYKRFFEDRKTGFPKYKSKRRGRKTYTTNLSHGNIELDDKARRLKLPKLGWLAVRQHKRIPRRLETEIRHRGALPFRKIHRDNPFRVRDPNTRKSEAGEACRIGLRVSRPVCFQ